MGPDRTRISGWGTPQRPRHRDTSSRIRKWRRSGRKKILFTPREPILSSRYTVSSLYRTLFSNSHFVASLLTFRLPPREEKRRKKKKKRKMAELRMRSGWWTLDGNGEGDGKGGRGGRGWLLDVSGITVRDEMKLKDSCCARRWWGGRRG